jgi:PAS domain S-box-containing protein
VNGGVTPLTIKKCDSVEDIEALRSKLADTEEKLANALDVISAIQSGEVDAVVVSRADGDQIFTLRGAEYAYRALVEAMNEGAATLAVDGTILYCNQRFSDLLGVQLEQIIGHPIRGLVKNGDDDLLRTLAERALLGTPAKSEFEMVAADGHSIPTLISLSKMKIEEPAALCMVVTDLTESKKWEQLVSAGKLASSILESSAEGIAVCDRDGKIVSVNDALKRLSGSNPNQEHFDRAFQLQVIRPPISQSPPP